MASYPPGDMVLGGLRGPMADETAARRDRVSLGLPTPDLSAQRRALARVLPSGLGQ
jgi:hypothetical protein